MIKQLISFETAKLAKEKGFYLTSFIENSLNENIVMFYDKSGDLVCQTNYEINCCVPDENPDEDVSEIPASTQAFLQSWLRNEKEIFLEIVIEDWGTFRYTYFRGMWEDMYSPEPEEHIYFETYEEALERGLQEALKLI